MTRSLPAAPILAAAAIRAVEQVAARIVPGGLQAAAQAVWRHLRAARLARPAFVAGARIDHPGQAIDECR